MLFPRHWAKCDVLNGTLGPAGLWSLSEDKLGFISTVTFHGSGASSQVCDDTTAPEEARRNARLAHARTLGRTAQRKEVMTLVLRASTGADCGLRL